MTKKDIKISKKIAFLLFALLFLTGLFTFKDYGISIDEEFQRSTGFYWLNYVLSFTSFEELKNLVTYKLGEISGFTLPRPEVYPYYGVIFDLPVAFLEVVFRIEDSKNYFHFRHLLNFLLFFISSIFFYKLLLNRFSNYYISLIGTSFFILSPRIYGSSYFNNKDIIFLSLVTMALYYCFKSFDKLNYKNLLIFSILAALSTSQRLLGIFLPIFFIIFYLLSVLSNKKDLKLLTYIFFYLVTYLLFSILFWPLLWEAPVENLILAFKYFTDVPLKIKMLFNGVYVNVGKLPHNYIFIWILISTPVLYIILFIIGYIQIFKRFFIKFMNIKDNNFYYDLWRGVEEKKDLFILFNITSITLYLVIFDVVMYTGWRQIYFINVFIIYIAVYAFYRINIYLKSKAQKKILFYIIISFLVFVVYKMTIYHPYQNIYFNFFAGKDIHKKFEIDYWGLSGKKFIEDILILEKDKDIISIAVSSFLPLQRSIKLLDKRDRKKIKIVGQEFQSADYIYTNFMSEVDKKIDDKYKIPSNFEKISEFTLSNIKVYEIYKKIEY